MTRHLSNVESERAKRRLAVAQASLACEGLVLTEEEKALFSEFEALRLSHEERRRRLLAFDRVKRSASVPSAAE